MKITTTRADGSTETVEGLPSEILELRRLSDGAGAEGLPPFKMSPPDPDRFNELLRRLYEEKQRSSFSRPISWEHSPTCLLVTARRGWMSVTPPHCTCGLTRHLSPSIGTITCAIGTDVELKQD